LRAEAGAAVSGLRRVATRLRAAAAVAVIGIAITACSGDRGLSALPADAVVLAFGDSITYGTGAGAGESYPEVLAGLIGREVVSRGVPGELSARGLERLPGVLEALRPRLVILCHGGNDILRRQPLARTGDHLRAMIRLIRDSGAEVVLVGVPRFGLMLDTAPIYEEVAEELGVPIEADILPAILSDNDLKADAVHPNAAGYARLASALQQLLQRSGAL
jgi:lysophospholipase L1-like esterase